MVLVNALLFLFLVGAWSYTEQATRVLGDDAAQACAVALQTERADPDELWFDYDLTDLRFGGRDILAADVALDGRLREVHCTVTVTGANSSDPVTVDKFEVLP